MRTRFTQILVPMLLGIAIGFYGRGLSPNHSPDQSAGAARNPLSFPRANVPARHSSTPNSNLTLDGLSAAEIQKELDRVGDIGNIHERSARFCDLMRRWSELDARGAFEYLNVLAEGEMKTEAMAAVAKTLAFSDPQYLAARVMQMPSNRSRRDIIQELTKSWSESDLHAALEWAEKLPHDLSRKDALAIIREQWASEKPEEASSQISQIPAGDSRNSLITAIAAQWGLSDPKKALEWAATLPVSEKNLATSNLIGAWAQKDPLKAGGYVAQLPAGELQNQAAMSVISSWSAKSPADSAAWVLQFPEGMLQEQGLHEVMNAWTTRDSESARTWAQKLPPGPTRDFALKSYVESTAYWSPDKAAGMVGMINDQGRREETMEITMRLWSEVDPDSARTWLAKLNVPDNLRDRLQSAARTN
jgi:hypothetical protein